MTPRKLIILSLITGLVLMVAKFGAYLLTNSNAILTDAAESIVNVVASAFAFYSIYLTALPKDDNHPYGHGKVEFFSVFLEGGLISIAGVLILGKAVYNLFFPESIENLPQGIGVIGFTCLVNFILGTYMIRKGKEFNSITIEADGRHLRVDAFSTLGLMAGLAIVQLTGMERLDVFLSLGLGCYITFSGYRLLRKSVGGLMDESDFVLINRVVRVLQLKRRREWIDVHNLRVQRYGAELHIDCHLTLPNYFDLNRVHKELSLFEKLVKDEVNKKTELFIHADPCLPQCCHYCKVENCPIRSADYAEEVLWEVNLLTRNKKHFDIL